MAVSHPTYFAYLRPRKVRRGAVLDDLLPPVQNARSVYFKRLGAIALVTAIQTLLWIQTIVQSPLLPGNWAQYQTAFLVDVIYSNSALGLIALLPLFSPKKSKELVVQPGGAPGLGVTYSMFSVVGLIAFIGLNVLGGHVSGSQFTDVQVLQGLVQVCLFVSVSEELFFRVAWSEYIGGIGSSVLFGFFHIWAYSTGTGAVFGWDLLVHLGVAAFYGAIFYFAYYFWGIGAAIGLHTAYDLVASGLVGHAGIVLSTMGLGFLAAFGVG